MILSNGMVPVIRVPVVDNINERLKDYYKVNSSCSSIRNDPKKLALAKQHFIELGQAARKLGWSDKTDKENSDIADELYATS